LLIYMVNTEQYLSKGQRACGTPYLITLSALETPLIETILAFCYSGNF